jgi:2'-5' RNA ligase
MIFLSQACRLCRISISSAKKLINTRHITVYLVFIVEVVRAFLALDLSNEIKDRIMDLEGRIGRSGADVKLVEKENLHVTMKFLGDINDETVDKIHGIMKGVRESKFAMEVRGTGVFPNTRMVRVLWAGVGTGSDKVISIFRQLDSGAAQFGFARERDFTPHITVGRVRSQGNREELLKAIEKYAGEGFGTTRVDKVILKKSTLTPSGPIYSNLREVELQG